MTSDSPPVSRTSFLSANSEECGGMSASAAMPRTTPLDRYFEVALYLMVLSGFATLAQTGQLDPPTVLLVVGALIVRGYLLARGRSFVLPENWTGYLTIGFLVLSPVDFLLVSGGFVTSTVHLVLALMVVRLFSARRDRDFVFLSILAFLQVLAASVLTVDSTFLVAFAAFLLAAVGTFILMEMRRSARAASVLARSATTTEHPRLGPHLATASPVLVLYILVLGAVIFLVLPRISGGYLSAFSTPGELSAGFSERVELGQIGQIQQSSSVVMHVQIRGDHKGVHDLKWRGVALNYFDGRSWSGSTRQFIIPRSADGRFVVPLEWSNPLSERERQAWARRVHYRVLLEPLGSNVFFLAPRPESLEGVYQMVTTDGEGAVYDLDREHPIGLYEGDSDIAEPPAAELRLQRDTATEYSRRYLQLPRLDPRVAELAREITSGAATNYDKAAAIEQYLRSNYGYTLNLGQTTPRDPLATFLFERKQGHCEYFASSMAVMLRTLKVPARIVNGFRTGEFNDITSQYLVRASNAHSWVEVYFPGYGWVGFDPTPAAIPTLRSGWGRIMLYLDAAASIWREWVINYDFGHQRALGQEAAQTTLSFFERLRGWSRAQYSELLDLGRKTRARLAGSPNTWALAGVLAVLLLFAAINLGRIWKFLRLRWAAAHPAESPRIAASIWYERMTRNLARRGWSKSPSQTPGEFVTSIDDPLLRQAVVRFTDRYRGARFGGSSEAAGELPELYEEVSAAVRR